MICLLESCEISFKPSNSLQKYCSAEHRREASNIRNTITMNCLYCGGKFQGESRRKYCSHACAATVSNSSRDRMRECLKCSTQTPAKFKYCTNCDPRFYVQRWTQGLESGSGACGKLKDRCRNYLLEQASYRCPKCGWSIPNPVTGKPILTINHIDGNWKNNSIDNLEVLCYNCHTLTETFGSLNAKSAGRRGSGPREYK